MTEGELEQIGPYALIQTLSTSSTSSFYLSKHKKKDVVIQRLHVPIPTHEGKEAFLLRAKQLKKLKVRGIVAVQEFGFDGDYPYLVMEHVVGKRLHEHMIPGKVTPGDARSVVSLIANALQYAHTNNILHGNLHSGAILFNERNEPYLTAFALSLPTQGFVLDDEAFAIPYMAPEQLSGQLTFASDQYALAVLAYELLCGQRPYEATERELLLQQQKVATIPAPRSLNDAISPAVEQVLLQALSYEPSTRFERVQDFSDSYLHALMGIALKPSNNVTASRTTRPTPSTLPQAPMKAVSNGGAPQAAPPKETTIAPATHQESNDAAPAQAEKPIVLTASLNNTRFATTMKPEPAPTSEPQPVPVVKQPAEPPVKTLSPRIASTLDDDMEDPGESQLHRKVSDDLRQGGILSQRLPGYEERPAQVEMATLIARSLNENVHAILEAATGTGKSLAYLVPIVRSGKVAIISTANKALQEQLFYKDIPFVQKHIKYFEAALVKGVSNYVCIDRMETERTGMQFYTKNTDFRRLVDIVNDPEAGFMGDFETLGFQLPADIRSRVATDSDQCAWNKCSYFGDCYVKQMRDRAEMAQVIVVNHTLLLLDAAIGGFLLPSRDVIVLDEAHHLEEEATRSFTITINPHGVEMLLAQRMLKTHSQLSLQAEAERALNNTWESLRLVADLGFKGRVNLAEPLEEGLKLATAIADLADSLRKQRPKDLSDRDEPLYDKLLKRTQNLAENIRTVFSVADTKKFVYYVERVQGPGARNFPLQVSAAPLDVTSWLRERLFDKCNVISTSATLATIGPNPINPDDKGPNFAYFRRRVGLDPIELPDVLERILPLAFDYESNALLYLPRHLPEPAYGTGSEGYMKAIAREMYTLVKVSRGRAFLLFSSKRMLDYSYELMSPHLDFPLLKQGDMTRLELTRRFREEEGAVLFGLKSFWEGVDIAGDALSLVVIDKLPFDPPDDPVHEARVAQMKAAGENWFGRYVLPQAVLRLKQGLGRLLRTRQDRGVMAILDTRLHTKGYGKTVLNALPPARRTASIRDVEQFFTLTPLTRNISSE